MNQVVIVMPIFFDDTQKHRTYEFKNFKNRIFNFAILIWDQLYQKNLYLQT